MENEFPPKFLMLKLMNAEDSHAASALHDKSLLTRQAGSALYQEFHLAEAGGLPTQSGTHASVPTGGGHERHTGRHKQNTHQHSQPVHRPYAHRGERLREVSNPRPSAEPASKTDRPTDLIFSIFLSASFSFLSGMTLSGSWWVVGSAHCQAFTFSWRRLSRSRSVVRRAHIQTFEQKKLAHVCWTP